MTKSDVSIGYTGLPKDMNLKDGDRIDHGSTGAKWTLIDGFIGAVRVENLISQYTLVSRADTSQENAWAISGDTEVDYTTHDVAEYRGKAVATRKKLPVVETRVGRVIFDDIYMEDDERVVTVVTTDGVPDWSTLKVKS